MTGLLKQSSGIGIKPELKWLPIESLRVDYSYQRSSEGKASQQLINKIASGFKWEMFQTLTVCAKSDKGGVFYNVIEGQHRLLGAKKRGDIRLVPCSIIAPLSPQDEAAFFAAMNQNRVRMHTVDVFHAAVAGGDAKASIVARVCKGAGIKICKAPFTTDMMPAGHTQAVGTIMRLLTKEGIDEKTVIRALKCLNDAHPEKTGQMRARMVQAIVTLFDINIRSDIKIDDKRLMGILAENDAADLEAGARAQKDIYGGDVSLGIIDDLVGVYNEGLPVKQYITGGA